jgi:prepilin-type N-terminal cleavage/methylation domain-containing protein
MRANVKKQLAGFTIIELLVGLALASIVITAAASVMVTAVKTEAEARARSQMTRDLALIGDALAYDLGYAGTGVPYGVELETDATPVDANSDPTDGIQVPTETHPRPVIRVGEATALAMVGDLPMPNSQFNGIVGLALLTEDDGFEGGRVAVGTTGFAAGANDAFAVTSELSTCSPAGGSASTYGCNTLLSNVSGVTSGASCTSAATAEPTCPWGLGKWQLDASGEVFLHIGTLTGDYYYRKWTGDISDEHQRAMVHLEHGFPAAGEQIMSNASFYIPGSGGGFAGTLDRVFWRLVDDGGAACGAGELAAGQCKMQRRQCWGPASDRGSNTNFDWPDSATASTAAAFTTPKNCGAGNGTDWEDIIDGVSGLTFRYFHESDGASSPTEVELVAPLDADEASRTRAVQFTVTVARSINDKVIRDTITRRVFMPHPGGVVPPIGVLAVPTNLGGCCGPATTPTACLNHDMCNPG